LSLHSSPNGCIHHSSLLEPAPQVFFTCALSIVVAFLSKWSLPSLQLFSRASSATSFLKLLQGKQRSRACVCMAPSLLQSAVAGGAAVISLTAAAYFYRRSLCSGGRRRAVGIIPARFQSSRFEGKPLAHILGKPMIQVLSPSPFLPATLSLPTTTAASSRSSRPHCDISYCTLHVALHVTLKGSNCMFLWLLLISFSTVLLEAEADLCGCTLQRTWEQAVQATALEAVGMSKPWDLSLFC
jgi:hypothetical protein